MIYIARCILKHRLVEIFVPLDTSGDYLLSDDAACDFIGSLRSLVDNSDPIRIKIIAYERSVTISGILSIFNHLIKQPVNRNSHVESLSPEGFLQIIISIAFR